MRSKGVLNLFPNGILPPTAVRLGILEALFRVVPWFSLSLGVFADIALLHETAACGTKSAQ